jgi:hypothetical protein
MDQAVDRGGSFAQLDETGHPNLAAEAVIDARSAAREAKSA